MNDRFDATALFWLPRPPASWRDELTACLAADPSGRTVRGLCSTRLDISQLRTVAARLRAAEAAGADLAALRHLRLGLIGAGTLDFLADAVPGTAPRFGLRVRVEPVEYNGIASAAFGRMAFAGPLDVVAIIPDAGTFVPPAGLLDRESHRHAVAEARTALRRIVDAVRQKYACEVVVATIAGNPDNILTASDRMLPGSEASFIGDFNAAIIELAAQEALALWDLAGEAAAVGLRAWRDPLSQHVAKSPFAVALAPVLADRLCALIAGLVGKSRRVLVLDLDNTCWGGVIGDDGLDGIVVGQGDAAGEAFLALQRYALNLRERGIVLCVCSKNDDAVAREPFRSHPDMLLREEHIAVFQANWNDKASNLNTIAEQLALNPDALVFVDDNPAERARVRQQFPEVAVPELPDDPAWFTAYVAAGGYFENPRLNAEDLARATAYQGNARRAEVRRTLGDYDEYLRSLHMVLSVRPFDRLGRSRITQLINKSNQFNLTTRRRSEADVAAVEAAPDHIGLQFRLADAFGDNGMICVVILWLEGAGAVIDTWLMSCRVLERQVEQAVLNEIVRALRGRGVERLIGEYVPTARNAMVAEHYPRLGFAPLPAADGAMTRWELELAAYRPFAVNMEVSREEAVSA